MMTGRRGYGCGGLFFQNEVSIPPLIQNDYLLLKKRIYETDKTGFLHGERGRNQNHDIYGVRPAYPAYGMRGKSGTVCRCEPADTGNAPGRSLSERNNGTVRPFTCSAGTGRKSVPSILRVVRKRSLKRPAMMPWTATMPWKVSGRSCQDCVNYLLKNCISGLRKR